MPRTAAALAEHSLYEYQRLVQKEAEPELIIQLPNRLEDQEEQEGFPAPAIVSEDASTHKDVDISVTVAFAMEQPKCGLSFHGKYACTDSQVGGYNLHDAILAAQGCCSKPMCPYNGSAWWFCIST